MVKDLVKRIRGVIGVRQSLPTIHLMPFGVQDYIHFVFYLLLPGCGRLAEGDER